MPTDHRERLARIRRFDQLVAYLRDELGWPIARESFEDEDELFYDYTAAELGISGDVATKIEQIKRLRPLTPNQPFGIFFVKFEPKRLPVVVLRRILGQVALKKRASANKSERQAWAADDLLFVSNYGEGDERRIAFAHFSEPQDGNDLPTLKVLGWDNLDTPLHLDAVARELTGYLGWPADEDDADAWRERWRGAFSLRHREVISTSKQLSERLAELARAIRDRVKTALDIETETGPLTKLMTAFRTALVHDLDEAGFADMYAQTIAYGLLSARITNPARRTADDFAAHMRTNPFLRDLMETFLYVGGRRGKAGGSGIDFDELGVSEVVELLDRANMEAVVRDFGDRNPQEDPVIHFYEHFLAAYDKKQKVSRGVFYTPRPVVSYIVHSVDELLRSEFGLADGLADTTTWGEIVKRREDLEIPDGTQPEDAFVQILDPATGTGTFLVEVIDLIHKTMVEKWQAQGHTEKRTHNLWNSYVQKHLLPRLHGYELLMAPYAIAHLKVGLKLYETGYKFETDERARVYLTNALEPPADFSGHFDFMVPALAHEAQAVNEIKEKQRFTIVIGNPPYSRSISEPEWLMRLLDEWKQELNEKKSDLNREEWKFLRFAQYHCARSAAGIVGVIINRDFLDGIAKRRMRQELGKAFPLRVIVDLNGDVKGNISDENVFEIEQGVTIAVLSSLCHRSLVRFSSRVGARLEKYVDLVAKRPIDASLINIEVSAPYFRWVPLPASAQSTEVAAEYSAFVPLNEMFRHLSAGIQTKNDAVCIAWTPDEILARVRFLADASPEEANRELAIKSSGAWSLAAAQKELRAFGISRMHVRRILYRPFDWRFTYLTQKSGGFLGRPRTKVMQHMVTGVNIGLVFNRQVVGANVSHFGVSRDLICHGTFYLGNKGQDYLAPLYLNDGGLGLNHSGGRHNLTTALLERVQTRLGVQAGMITPLQILEYIYGVVHSVRYRKRYGEHLKLDFPRIPLAANATLFRALAKLGSELVALHVMESPELDEFVTAYTGPRNVQIGRVGWSRGTVWLDAGKTSARDGHRASKPGTMGFTGVPEEVWDFYMGGYQVCHKWLKDRKGRPLSEEGIAHYQKIVVALNKTIRIMAEIDEVIEAHGGWPGAFETGSAPADEQAALSKVAESSPPYRPSKDARKGDR